MADGWDPGRYERFRAERQAPFTDLLAVGAMLRARQLGLAVPDDIAIAGYGDLETSRHMATPLTTVHVSSYDMGHAAGSLLLKRLRNEAIGERMVLSPIRLEVRESTGAAASGGASAIDSRESAAG